MLGWCWHIGFAAGPTLTLHWANASCLLGYIMYKAGKILLVSVFSFSLTIHLILIIGVCLFFTPFSSLVSGNNLLQKKQPCQCMSSYYSPMQKVPHQHLFCSISIIIILLWKMLHVRYAMYHVYTRQVIAWMGIHILHFILIFMIIGVCFAPHSYYHDYWCIHILHFIIIIAVYILCTPFLSLVYTYFTLHSYHWRIHILHSILIIGVCIFHTPFSSLVYTYFALLSLLYIHILLINVKCV